MKTQAIPTSQSTIHNPASLPPGTSSAMRPLVPPPMMPVPHSGMPTMPGVPGMPGMPNFNQMNAGMQLHPGAMSQGGSRVPGGPPGGSHPSGAPPDFRSRQPVPLMHHQQQQQQQQPQNMAPLMSHNVAPRMMPPGHPMQMRPPLHMAGRFVPQNRF